MNKHIYILLRRFLPFAVTITLLYGFIYLVLQQNYRQSANDPQIQIAEDTAGMLKNGYSPQYIVSSGATVDIDKSLSPFVVIYEINAKSIVTSGQLDGSSPHIPPGVFEYVKEHGEDRFTWQPREGVRVAAVVVPYQGRESGYVLAGRNLREVEIRELRLEVFTLAAWIFSMVSCALIMLFEKR